jgi:hypothetical protein
MGVGAADRSHFSGLNSGQRRSGSTVSRDVGAVSEFRADDDRGICRRLARKLGGVADQHGKHLVWIEISDLKT